MLLADLLADPDTASEEILRESCSHLGRSLDLLSRVLHHSPPVSPRPVSIRESLHFIEDLHRAARTPARLELAIEPSVQPAAGVEGYLEHALLNLVLNSLEALQDREEGLIRITARNEGHTVEIAVADNGPGVAPGLVGRLFQASVTTKTGGQLVGLGLLVASEVLRLSGGRLTYAPASNPGARFVITLPHWRDEAPRAGDYGPDAG